MAEWLCAIVQETNQEVPGWLQNISARSAPYGQKSSGRGRGGGGSRFGGRDYRQDRGYGGGGGGYGGGGGGFGGGGGYGAPCESSTVSLLAAATFVSTSQKCYVSRLRKLAGQ